MNNGVPLLDEVLLKTQKRKWYKLKYGAKQVGTAAYAHRARRIDPLPNDHPSGSETGYSDVS